MNASSCVERICCVTVTYQPDLAILRRQMEMLPTECKRVVVDNASDAILLEPTRQLLDEFGVELLRNPRNLGLAAAQNQGAETALRLFPETSFLLFLDQDTEAEASAVVALLEGYLSASGHEGAGAAGPRMVDEATGMHHGFHVMRGVRWLRVYPDASQTEPVYCANLNGSGTLVPVDVWCGSGGMDESLFIDHVDTDWAFRMRARGYRLYGIPRSQFIHRMGESSMRVWLFGWHVWPTRSPMRHFFLFRNTVRLLRRDYVPFLWKCWAVAKLTLTLLVTVLNDSRRWQQLRQMMLGVLAGMAFPRLP